MINRNYNKQNSVYNTYRSDLTNKTNGGYTKPLNNKKQSTEKIKFRIDKSLIKGETQYSLLYFINEKESVWIPKTICFGSLFTNWLTVWVSVDYKFRVNPVDKTVKETVIRELLPQEFKEIVENDGVNQQWM